MPRETKKVVTPIGKKTVVLNTYITGREERAIIAAPFEGVKVSPGSGIGADVQFTPEMLNASKDKAIITVVVSIDGSDEKILDKVLDMHSVDTQFILAEVEKVTSPVKEEEKKS